MDPITQTFSCTKEQVMDAYVVTLEALSLKLNGRNDRLGLISSKDGSKPLLYAHFIEQQDDQTKISIAPGIANLKDRDNSERPDAAIQRVMNELKTQINANK